jgi:hypothetical protein
MKRITLFLLIALAISSAYGQSAAIYFPRFAEQEWSFTVFRGAKQDTLLTGKLDEEGRAKLILPDSCKNYRGMTRWLLTKGGGLTMIFSGGEDFSVSCTEAQPSDESIIYSNTSENNYLNSRYKRQQNIFNKVEAMRMATKAYQDDTDLLPAFNEELQKQEQAYDRLQVETESNPLYAARFAQIVDLMRGLPRTLSSDDVEENEKQMKEFIINQLDIDALYTSGHWSSMWEQWLSWYTHDKENHLPQLVPDAKCLLARTRSDEVYAALAEQIVSVCDKRNWYDQEIELAFYLLNEDRIKQPKGEIASVYTLLKIRKGLKAPALLQGTFPEKKTILVFYDSNCGNCTKQLGKLAEDYPEWQKKGYEVVSVSADSNKGMFESYAEKLPWKDKYCDFEGFAGKDFINYGVMATPTFYLLDDKGIVQGRYARVEDIAN